MSIQNLYEPFNFEAWRLTIGQWPIIGFLCQNKTFIYIFWTHARKIWSINDPNTPTYRTVTFNRGQMFATKTGLSTLQLFTLQRFSIWTSQPLSKTSLLWFPKHLSFPTNWRDRLKPILRKILQISQIWSKFTGASSSSSQ